MGEEKSIWGYFYSVLVPIKNDTFDFNFPPFIGRVYDFRLLPNVYNRFSPSNVTLIQFHEGWGGIVVEGKIF